MRERVMELESGDWGTKSGSAFYWLRELGPTSCLSELQFPQLQKENNSYFTRPLWALSVKMYLFRPETVNSTNFT